MKVARRKPNTASARRMPAAAARRLLIQGVFGSLAVIVGATAAGRSAAAAQDHDFRICHGYFALCAASTCTPTGKTITVKVAGGGTARYPEAQCNCPIEAGDAIADVAGGNMRGSCRPPGPGALWSLYSIRKEIPQQVNHWVQNGPAAAAPLLYCSKNFNLGSQLANCFSFACNNERYINGVPVATCYCPLGESPEGTMVAPHTGFVTQAGQDDDRFCAEHPVGGPVSFP